MLLNFTPNLRSKNYKTDDYHVHLWDGQRLWEADTHKYFQWYYKWTQTLWKAIWFLFYQNYKYNSILSRDFTSGIYPTDRSYVHKGTFTEALVETAKG